MPGETIQCDTHGEQGTAFVCHHLLGVDAVNLGFNRNEPTADDPTPDAWCDDCEVIRVAHDGWNAEAEKLTTITLLCSSCYNRASIRNTHTSTTLDDLADLHWKCHTCEEWHTGPCLDFSYDSPVYWTDEHEKKNKRARLLPSLGRRPDTFLDEDHCAIDNEDFFVRGIIHLPIIGTNETFRWGVWGSLSKDNFEKLLAMDDDPKRVDLPSMFSWLSNEIAEYPDTTNLKMYAHIQPVDWRPHFELEHGDHPLAQEFHHGVTPERVKELMLGRLRDAS